MRLEGYAIVTGGARGIGAALCMQLAREGYNVVINYVSDSSKEKADALIAKMADEYGVKGIGVQASISDFEQCKKIVETAISAFGQNIAILVNNAGAAAGKRYLQCTPEELRLTVETDLLGAIYLTQLVVPHMVEQGYGAIVNIASTAGIMGSYNDVAYSSSKAGIIGFTKSIAREFGPQGVTVNAIAPGLIATEIIKNLPPERLEEMKKEVLLGGLGEPQDIADALSYIVNAKFLTGQIISPNGGYTI